MNLTKRRIDMTRLKNVPVLFLLLALTLPGCGGFDTSIRRVLTTSQITYEGAMDAVALVLESDKTRSEDDKIITAGIAKRILVYETRHRTVHNMIVTMTDQYVGMREAGVGNDQLDILAARIGTFQANLAIIISELLTFLMEKKIYGN